MSNEATESGFTLIELVVVIVIIGILAAAALPRFVDLTDDAKEGAAQGIAGSLSGASAMVHGKWLASGLGTSSGTFDIGNETIAVNVSGYPKDVSDLKKILRQDPAKSSASWEWDSDASIGASSSDKVLTTADSSWCVSYHGGTGVATVVSSSCP